MDAEGFTVWLTGLSGAGKSTLARELQRALTAHGQPSEVLDGDELRRSLSADLGFSPRDRAENVRRITFVANLLARHGVAVLVAAISPSRGVRDLARAAHERPFVEVFVDCPVDVLQRRDPKGLYRRAQAGEIAEFTGVSAPYEPPIAPAVHLRTDRSGPAECVEHVLARLSDLGLLKAGHGAGAVSKEGVLLGD